MMNEQTSLLVKYILQECEKRFGKVKDIYPVGSIYMSASDTDPASLFGGTWERIQGRFLLAAGSGYAAGATGGEATHTLTENEMPAHNHEVLVKTDSGNATIPSTPAWQAKAENTINASTLSTLKGTSAGTWRKGGGAAHNNMPPYLAVYMWRRTA